MPVPLDLPTCVQYLLENASQWTDEALQGVDSDHPLRQYMLIPRGVFTIMERYFKIAKERSNMADA